MTDYSELKRLAEDVNNNFPDKEDLWSMVCTPATALDLIADFDQLKVENEALRKVLAEAGVELRELKASIGFRANTLEVLRRIDGVLSKEVVHG